MKLRLGWIILLFSFCCHIVQANADEDREVRAKKLNSLGELISKSSVSRQIAASSNEAALQQYKQAQSLHEQAIAANNSGKFEESDRLLSQAKKALFEAARLSIPKGANKEKEKSRYDFLKRSIGALLEAFQRISTEKGKGKQAEAIATDTRNLMKQADQQYAAGHGKEGTALLAKAMQGIDGAIKEMRSGDTLTRTLSFSTPKEEYLYEVERNNTHLMLVDAYKGEMADDENKRNKVEEHLRLSMEFRAKAEEMAAKDRYQDAVREMESSTLNIIRAIRALGVFIPG